MRHYHVLQDLLPGREVHIEKLPFDVILTATGKVNIGQSVGRRAEEGDSPRRR